MKTVVYLSFSKIPERRRGRPKENWGRTLERKGRSSVLKDTAMQGLAKNGESVCNP